MPGTPTALLLSLLELTTTVRPAQAFDDCRLEFLDREYIAGSQQNGQSNAEFVAVSPDGNHVYVASVQDDAVVLYDRNAATGLLTRNPLKPTLYQDGVAGVDGLDGASSVAVSPDGFCVYVASRVEDAVASFSRNPDGTLIWKSVLKEGTVTGLNAAINVAVSPDSAHVYVASASSDGIALLTPNATCELAFTAFYQDNVGPINGLAGAEAVAVSPDGLNVYAVSPTEGTFNGAVAVFSRATGTGLLTFREAHVESAATTSSLQKAQAITVSPDNRHVYVAAGDDAAISLFARDLMNNGVLTFVAAMRDNVCTGGQVGLTCATDAQCNTMGMNDGVCMNGLGLLGAEGVAVSPDGQHVYATADSETVGGILEKENAVVMFDRDTTTGQLTWRAKEVDREPGDPVTVEGVSLVESLEGAEGVVVSPDSAHVYVAADGDNAVTAFAPLLDDDEACNDDVFCNGIDSCSSLSCATHAGNPCPDPGPDGDANCADLCNELTNDCNAHEMNDSMCDLGACPMASCTNGVCVMQVCDVTDACGTCDLGRCAMLTSEPCGCLTIEECPANRWARLRHKMSGEWVSVEAFGILKLTDDYQGTESNFKSLRLGLAGQRAFQQQLNGGYWSLTSGVIAPIAPVIGTTEEFGLYEAGGGDVRVQAPNLLWLEPDGDGVLRPTGVPPEPWGIPSNPEGVFVLDCVP